jgi:hypothetical protein
MVRSVAHLMGWGRLLAIPRLGCLAWGYHSVRQLRRLVECLLLRSHLFAAKSCAVSLRESYRRLPTTETQRTRRFHREG